MMPPQLTSACVLTGPTGSGKSDLALRLAESFDAEIIAMDSMTLYRGMDIGTAKPTLADRRRVPHHLIDVLDPWESSSVAWWLDQATQRAREIESRGHRVLFVGGTPLYLKALLHGLFQGPPANPEIRQRLEDEAQREGRSALHQRLANVDPATAAKLHPNDLRRVVRALEVWEITRKPISEWRQEWCKALPGNGIRCWWIDLPRALLYARINERVARMMRDGWLDEVRRLYSADNLPGREANQALGYAELREHLEGRLSLNEAVALICLRSRQFAKRQLTWFRSLTSCRPLSPDATEETAPTFWPDFT